MNASTVFGAMIGVLFALGMSAPLQNTAVDQAKLDQDSTPSQQAFLESLVGSWAGTCRTWFRPGELADESEVEGEIQVILGGRFLRHTYEGKLQGKPRTGEETIAFNSVTGMYQISWVDDFHMNYGIMFSEGEPTEMGFVVNGSYDVAPDQPPWGWKTVFELTHKDHLTITAYNVMPDGEEVKAIETKYTRKNP